jgi:hypothetical protein
MFSIDHAANPCSIEADARRVISWLHGHTGHGSEHKSDENKSRILLKKYYKVYMLN